MTWPEAWQAVQRAAYERRRQQAYVDRLGDSAALRAEVAALSLAAGLAYGLGRGARPESLAVSLADLGAVALLTAEARHGMRPAEAGRLAQGPARALLTPADARGLFARVGEACAGSSQAGWLAVLARCLAWLHTLPAAEASGAASEGRAA